MNRSTRGMRTLVIVGLVATAGFVTLRGQRDAPDRDEMNALVAEVRALRLVIERAAASTSQSQLLLGRVQLQENRLATLARQYQEVRARSLDAQMAQAGIEQQLRQMVNVEHTTRVPPEERQVLEQRVAELKNQVAQQKMRTGQVQSEEAAVAEALATEQQRWSDFNNRLESIERALGRDALPPK